MNSVTWNVFWFPRFSNTPLSPLTTVKSYFPEYQISLKCNEKQVILKVGKTFFLLSVKKIIPISHQLDKKKKIQNNNNKKQTTPKKPNVEMIVKKTKLNFPLLFHTLASAFHSANAILLM